jgi:hypothetical protein
LRSAWLINRAHSDEAIAHFAFDLGLGHERRHAIQHDDLKHAGADQRLADFERLLGGIRLGDVQIIDIHADAGRIGRIHGVFHIDESADAAQSLCLGNGVQADGGLAGAFRAIDLRDTPARDAANAGGNIDGQRTGRDGLHLQMLGITQAQDSTIPKAFGQFLKRRIERLAPPLVRHSDRSPLRAVPPTGTGGAESTAFGMEAQRAPGYGTYLLSSSSSGGAAGFSWLWARGRGEIGLACVRTAGGVSRFSGATLRVSALWIESGSWGNTTCLERGMICGSMTTSGSGPA